ncbi:hypothetical protein N7499_004079 [Penicillium canescens]|nr:hypothetical protein N7499_004079 [Penicillium canescens]KAJ6181491.1 hypothetical protein N7485_000133 [Penicillium canescens]
MECRDITRATIDIASETASQCAPVCVTVGQQGLSGSVIQIEDYSNGRGLQPPEGPSVAYKSRLESANQNLSISGNEETNYQSPTRGIDTYNAETVAWGSGQLHNQDHGCPQDGNIHYQSSACGFDNYEPVALVPGQLYNQDHGRPQDASDPYQTEARGFGNYDAESVAWGSGQLHNQGHGCPQGGNMPYQSLACGFDKYEPVALVPGQFYNQDHEHPQDASIPYRNLAHEPNNPIL